MPTKLIKQLLSLKLFLIVGLILSGPLSYAQDGAAESEARPATQTEIQEDHDTKNLDKLLQNYNKDQQQVLKDAEKLIPKDDTGELSESEMGEGEVLDPNDENSLRGKEKIGVFDSKLLKAKSAPKVKGEKIHYAEEMRKSLLPLQSQSEKELIKLLLETTRKTEVGTYIDRFPKLAVFTIRLVKDPNALPMLVSILDDMDKVIHFAGLMISTILVAFLLKRLMKREGRPIWKAVGLWFFRFLIMTSLRIAIVFYFFDKQIEGVFKLAYKTFL